MKRSQIKTKKWKKIVGCTAITLVLACVFVVGFFAARSLGTMSILPERLRVVNNFFQISRKNFHEMKT